jgi:hypothetical protein
MSGRVHDRETGKLVIRGWDEQGALVPCDGRNHGCAGGRAELARNSLMPTEVYFTDIRRLYPQPPKYLISWRSQGDGADHAVKH